MSNMPAGTTVLLIVVFIVYLGFQGFLLPYLMDMGGRTLKPLYAVSVPVALICGAIILITFPDMSFLGIMLLLAGPAAILIAADRLVRRLDDKKAAAKRDFSQVYDWQELLSKGIYPAQEDWGICFVRFRMDRVNVFRSFAPENGERTVLTYKRPLRNEDELRLMTDVFCEQYRQLGEANRWEITDEILHDAAGPFRVLMAPELDDHDQLSLGQNLIDSFRETITSNRSHLDEDPTRQIHMSRV
ncbi:MAG: hypothetical protein II458_03040 [Oscillospiraceae bacterium]|nr:hypothetical protein [Oscillospiraceae bacterium]